jgi:DNA-binding HxlR family transcriptional regulator
LSGRDASNEVWHNHQWLESHERCGEFWQFVSLEPDRVTRTVDVLVKQGIVARRQDKQDRRRISLSLTAKGKRIHEQIERVRYALEYEFLSVLDDTELETLYRILDKLEPQAKSIFTSDGAWERIVNKYDADSFKKFGLWKTDLFYRRRASAGSEALCIISARTGVGWAPRRKPLLVSLSRTCP